MVKTPVDDLVDLGKDIAEAIATDVKGKLDNVALGALVGETGTSGDMIKIGDRTADKTGSKAAMEFINEENLEKIIIGDVWKTEEKPEVERRKLVLVSEDYGVKEYGDTSADDGIFIILDPIDGSNNLRPWRTPRPFVCTSVALGNLSGLKKYPNLDAVEVGVVKSIFTGDTYHATKGKGAYLEGWGRIKTSPMEELGDSIVGIDLDLTGTRFDKFEKKISKIMRHLACKRRLGASILDFCKVACGEYDAFLSIAGRMIVNDIGAVKLIVEEAGGVFDERIVGNGKVTAKDKDFLKDIIENRNTRLIGDLRFEIIATGNEALHKQILEHL